MSEGAPPVEMRGLSKRYGERLAVDAVDLTVQAGDVYGYLGPNGAGKTTSLRVLLGLIRPTEGVARLFGKDPQVSGARALDGVAGFVEAPRFYPYMSGRKNLELCAAYDGGGEANRRIDASLDLVDLADRAKDRVGSYSHGMKQRLGIAGALIRNPKLLVLDEPTTGLDPAGMRDMRELVRRLASEGLTVMLSSHLMSEVEELCNRVAIIRAGTILFDGELDELLKSDGESRRLRSSDQAQAAVIATRLGIASRIGDSGELELTGGDDELISRYTVELGRAGVGIIELTTGRGSLEHFFFQLTEDESEAPGLPAAEPEPAVAAAR